MYMPCCHFIPSEWIASLSKEATGSFLRGAAIGVELEEAWLCCCAATYVWNYNNHILSREEHHQIVDNLTAVLEALRAAGHAG